MKIYCVIIRLLKLQDVNKLINIPYSARIIAGCRGIKPMYNNDTNVRPSTYRVHKISYAHKQERNDRFSRIRFLKLESPDYDVSLGICICNMHYKLRMKKLGKTNL